MRGVQRSDVQPGDYPAVTVTAKGQMAPGRRDEHHAGTKFFTFTCLSNRERGGLVQRWAYASVYPIGMCMTIATGTGKSAGRRGTTNFNPWGPPVETPMTSRL